MRNWIGSQVTRERIPTRKKPHRRFGYLAPGYKRDYKDKWLAAIDTSGSTWCSDLLGDFLAILNQIVDDDIPLDFMQFDADITVQPHVYDRRSDHVEMSGKGGTNFQPVIDLVNRSNYKGVIILTDGQASPCSKPNRAQVLWALPYGHKPPVEWGDRVFLTKLVRWGEM